MLEDEQLPFVADEAVNLAAQTPDMRTAIGLRVADRRAELVFDLDNFKLFG